MIINHLPTSQTKHKLAFGGTNQNLPNLILAIQSTVLLTSEYRVILNARKKIIKLQFTLIIKKNSSWSNLKKSIFP
jgi:hypothetical protein